jgi:hypothetical protein
LHGLPFQDGKHRHPSGIYAGDCTALQPQPQAVDVTEEMVSAYLSANTEYWRQQDELPSQNPSKWRNGTPKEATRVSLEAALRASIPPQPQVVDEREAFEKWYEQKHLWPALRCMYDKSREYEAEAAQRAWEVWKAGRASLAQLTVAAEQEPFAWATFDGEGSYDLRLYEDNEAYRDDYIKRNGEKYASWVKPLYAHPAAVQRDEQELEEKTFAFGQTAFERLRMTLELIALRDTDLSPENLACSVLKEIGHWKADAAPPQAEAQQGLTDERIQELAWKCYDDMDQINGTDDIAVIASCIREAIESALQSQPAKEQEPIGEVEVDSDGMKHIVWRDGSPWQHLSRGDQLFTAPPQAEAQSNPVVKDSLTTEAQSKEKTMDEAYGDGSDHISCGTCGLCKNCGDCAKLGCGENDEAQSKDKP